MKGRINKDNLAKLYQGQITDWQQLGLENKLPVKLYKPEEEHLLESFITFITKPNESTTIAESVVKVRKFNSMLQKILQGFEETTKENRYGGIGFGLLSKIYGQCSVYPLAIDGVQPLVHNDGTPITPETVDLCNDKGSYRLNTNAFNDNSNLKKYPLIFAIAVIYKDPKSTGKSEDNKSKGEIFTKMMLTDEGQSILQEIGLVPVKNIQ